MVVEAFLWGSLTTVIDRLFLPGNIYVSLTHTIPSSRLALTLDEVTDDEEMDAELDKQTNITIKNCHQI